MSWYFIVTILIATFAFMEFMAWFMHKFVMHGFLWVLHKDHHIPHDNKLERNDFFALMFAIPSTLLILLGAEKQQPGFWIGIGILVYGIAYFTFHDVLIHNRLPVFKNKNKKYYRAIITAHNDHHSGKTNYGFLFMIPFRYFANEFRNTNKKTS